MLNKAAYAIGNGHFQRTRRSGEATLGVTLVGLPAEQGCQYKVVVECQGKFERAGDVKKFFLILGRIRCPIYYGSARSSKFGQDWRNPPVLKISMHDLVANR